jgi:hypothetical protein
LVALVVFTATLPKPSVVVESAVGTTPFPFSVTVCGLLPAVVLMVSVPGSATVDGGVSVSAMVQLAPAANVPVHVVDGSIAYGAVTGSELIVMEDVPVFLRVTILAGLVVFTDTLPKFTPVGEIVVFATAKLVEKRQIIAVRDNRTV